MRRAIGIWLCAALMGTAAARAEIIDRVAVSVGKSVITESDLYREIRITTLLNSAETDFSAANKRATASRLVDQVLIRNEIEVSRYVFPTPGDVDVAVKELKSQYQDEASYRRALAQYGVSEDDLKTRMLWQLTLVRFIDARFRPGIQVGEDEIRKYFDEHFRPALNQAHSGKTLSVEDYRDRIEETLTSEAANQQVEQWLKDARARTHIEYHEEVFR